MNLFGRRPKPTPTPRPVEHKLIGGKPTEGAPMLPTIGRIVHVHSRTGSGRPEPAIVCAISGSLLNVAGFDAFGDSFKLSSLPFVGDAHVKRPTSVHACWPPIT